MRNFYGSVTVSTAGTRVQASNNPWRVKYIVFRPRAGNSGVIYIGLSDVASTKGYELAVKESFALDYTKAPASVPISDFYADASVNGDKVDWWAVLDP